MKWKKRHGIFNTKTRWIKPYRVVLHHTAGGTMSGAVQTLIKRGLGYHYIITKKGDIHEFVPASKWTAHAYKNNRGTIGVSFVGGGRFGPMNAKQLSSTIQLLKVLKKDYPSIREVSGHKHVDPRGWKSDPMFPSERVGKVDWKVDAHFMNLIAGETGLTFVGKSDLRGYSLITWLMRG